MGCNQSKIENEESILRCKERKRYMKEAVSSRNAFAAAHSAYSTSLKNTGAALGDFSHGEVANPQSTTTSINTVGDNSYISPLVPPQKPFDIALPPPPLPPQLPPDFSPTLQRAASMPEIKSNKPDPRPMPNPILEEEDDDEELENEGSLRKRRSNRNVGVGVGVGGGVSSNSNRRLEDEEDEAPPPMPPPLVKQPPISSDHIGGNNNQSHHHHTMSNPQQNSAAWEYFFPSMENIAGTSLNEEGEHGGVTFNRMQHTAMPSRVGVVEEPVTARMGVGVGIPGRIPEHEEVMESPMESPLPSGLKMKQMPVTPPSMEAKRIVKHNNSVNLVQIFTDLDDHFLKASQSAHEVSKILEATRLHYHSNFADNRGILLHCTT